MGVILLFVEKFDLVGLSGGPWFTLEIAWIGLTGYGL
jgi:hypothetical protein